MNKKTTFFLVAVFLVVVAGILTYSASKGEKYTADSNNWRISLTVDKSGEYFGSLSCEYIGEITGTMKHFEYKLKGARGSISGSEEGNWEFGYKYKHGAISASALVPNESDQFEITVNLDGNTETLILTK